MCQGFCDLSLGQPVIHPDVDVASQLRDLPGGDQRTDGDKAPIARR
jgi:hypothetical protein